MPKDNGTSLALIQQDLAYIKRDVMEIKTKLEKDYVTQEEFSPVKKIVYGLVSIILVAVAGALIGLVVLR